MPEKIAILGGNRIPFARSNGPYAEASNQDMLTAALDGLVARFGLQGERAGEVVAGAVLKHSRDFNLTRECVLGSRARQRARPPTTSSRPATPACRRRSRSAARSRSARSSGASRAASTPPATPRSRSTRTCAGVLLRGQPHQERHRPARSCSATCGRARSCPRSRATPSRAPACRWASTRRSPPSASASRARSRTSSPWPATRASPPPTSAASSTTSSPRTSGSSATRTCARTRAPTSWRSSSRCSATR